MKALTLICLLIAAGSAAAEDRAVESAGWPKAQRLPDAGFSEDKDTIGFGEESHFMKQHCRNHPKDPACAGIPAEKRTVSKANLRELCKQEPLNERCQKHRDEQFEEMMKVEHFCKSTNNDNRCARMRKQAERSKKNY